MREGRSASTSRRRLPARVLSLTLASAIAIAAAPPASAAAPDSKEVQRLYLEGEERNAAKDYKGAYESWTLLMTKLPESAANQATRENVLLNIIDAHINAYNGMLTTDNKKDVAHLRGGKTTVDKYTSDFTQTFGDRKAISPAVQEKINELTELLKRAEEEEKEAAATTTETPTNGGLQQQDVIKNDPKDVVVLEPQNSGNGLIVGGSVVTFLGVGALAMLIIGGVRGKRADEDHTAAQALPDTDPDKETAIDRALFEGKQGNQLLIAGAVLAPLLLGGGITMLVFGIRKKQQAARDRARAGAMMTPTFGRGFAGVAIRGRF
jgi:hypothetical protein